MYQVFTEDIQMYVVFERFWGVTGYFQHHELYIHKVSVTNIGKFPRNYVPLDPKLAKHTPPPPGSAGGRDGRGRLACAEVMLCTHLQH